MRRMGEIIGKVGGEIVERWSVGGSRG